MQSAGQPHTERGATEVSPRAPAEKQPHAWFSDAAEQRRRRSLPPAQQARRPRPGLLGCIALAALTGAVVATQPFDTSMRPCRIEPAVLGSGAELAAHMTVSHNAACAIGTKIQSISAEDVRVEVAPQHGTLALRGRSGVTYRPAPEFTGNDFYAFALRGHAQARDNMSFVRVSVTVK
jgi:hypothetical protein